MSNNESETLEERLAKRRLLHRRRLLDNKNSSVESEIIPINRSPTTTQSLDRQSNKRPTRTKFVDEHKTSLPTIQNSELLPNENTNSKSNYISSNNKTNSTPLPSRLSKYQCFDSENEKQISSNALSINEQQQNEKFIINNNTVSSTLLPMISSTTIEKSNPIQQEIDKDSSSHQDKKPVVIKENLSSIFRPIIPLTTTEKSNSIVHETRENPTSNQIKDHSHTTFDYPLRYPRPNTDHSQQQFNFTPLDSKSVARAKSEEIISTNKSKHQLTDSKYPKLNLLALSYLFNRRMIAAGLAPMSSFDYEQPQRKTVWD
ncbi:unnamed protein product [Rotaria sordida]|uniref:Uncharacterized protein n=1 Tax=Rotaria sordida TaxID=392033 RepID=A0A814JAW2_9BILA|nr:unnamed protein product [Rotaria sordida]CAF3807193.1 unnamed protein product [Rotaria sordida]